MKGTRATAVLVVSLAFLASWLPVDHAEAGAGIQSSDTFGVGEQIPTFPRGAAALSGSFRNASIQLSGGVATVTIRQGGYARYSDYTYTCDVSECVIVDQAVTRGIVRREPTGGGTNQAPRATGSIPAQTLTVGGGAAPVNVARYFTDPDGDALTYTASSSRTGVVTVAVSGSTVTLAPVAAGTATVTVNARDPGGLSATQSIAVTVEDGGGTNQPPRPTGTIPAQTLTVGRGAAPVNVARYFTDPDGDALTYTASSSRIGVVTVAVSGSTVTLTPVATGTATVTVTARDPGGLSATQSIAVTAQGAGVNGFTNEPLVPGVTPVLAIHFRELRTRIDALRTQAGLSAYAWTDPTLRAGVTGVRGVHLTELRTALRQAYDASGQSPPAYTDAVVRAGTTPIRAAHITELRTTVVELENGGPTGLMPDLVVGSPTVTDSTLTSGQSFTLSVIVRNRGSARSAPTTLRYYRSTDATISTFDTEVGTNAVSGLAPGASSPRSIIQTAPTSARTYYYGACVEAVSGESNTTNNCSAGVQVTVESGGGNDIEVEITSCTGTRITPSLASITMRGTVRARVSVTSVEVRGTVNGSFLGTDFLGSIAAGSSKNFSISGVVPVSGTSIRCSARVSARRAFGAGAEESGGVTGVTTLDGALR